MLRHELRDKHVAGLGKVNAAGRTTASLADARLGHRYCRRRTMTYVSRSWQAIPLWDYYTKCRTYYVAGECNRLSRGFARRYRRRRPDER